MKKFIKEHAKLIYKLFLNQVALIVFGIMVSLPTSQNMHLLLAASIFSIGFYWFLIYYMNWEAGAKLSLRPLKTPNKISFWGSLVITLLGNALNILVLIFYSVCNIIYISSGSVESFAAELGAAAGLALKVLQAMFIGVESNIFPNPNFNLPTEFAVHDISPFHVPPLFYFITITLSVSVSVTAFVFGTREFSILRFFGIKLKNKQGRE